MVVSADAGLVLTGDEGRAAGGTDGGCGVGPIEADAALGERVEVGGLDEGFAVTGELWADVLGEDPEDVGARILRSECRERTRSGGEVSATRQRVRVCGGHIWILFHEAGLTIGEIDEACGDSESR